MRPLPQAGRGCFCLRGGRRDEGHLDGGGALLLHRRDAVHLHHGVFLVGPLMRLPFKGSCNFLESPATGLRDFEEGEDPEDDKEGGEDNENVGS